MIEVKLDILRCSFCNGRFHGLQKIGTQAKCKCGAVYLYKSDGWKFDFHSHSEPLDKRVTVREIRKMICPDCREGRFRREDKGVWRCNGLIEIGERLEACNAGFVDGVFHEHQRLDNNSLSSHFFTLSQKAGIMAKSKKMQAKAEISAEQIERVIRDAVGEMEGIDALPESIYLDRYREALELIDEGLKMRQEEIRED